MNKMLRLLLVFMLVCSPTILQPAVHADLGIIMPMFMHIQDIWCGWSVVGGTWSGTASADLYYNTYSVGVYLEALQIQSNGGFIHVDGWQSQIKVKTASVSGSVSVSGPASNYCARTTTNVYRQGTVAESTVNYHYY